MIIDIKEKIMTVYDFKVKDDKGDMVGLEKYKGKVLLIVNTATKCGFTPQYEGLEDLYQKYKDRGFEILDFPCNQFGGQAPGSIEDINGFCELNFGTSFDRFDKIDVNGENEDPLYTFLKDQISGKSSKDIRWNFTKFLINKKGEVVNRYDSMKKPKNIAKDIEELLNV